MTQVFAPEYRGAGLDGSQECKNGSECLLQRWATETEGRAFPVSAATPSWALSM